LLRGLRLAGTSAQLAHGLQALVVAAATNQLSDGLPLSRAAGNSSSNYSQPVDFDLYEHLNGLAFRHHALEAGFHFFGQDGQILFLVLLTALFFARGKWRSCNGRHGVAAAGFSMLLALGAAQVIASLWDRPRPYEAHPEGAHLLLSRSPDPSFPSDHATAAYAIAVAILLRHRKGGVLALIFATLIAVSRVALGTHYPSDILGGAVLGALSAAVLWTPPIRRPLHRLANRTGALYDRASGSLAKQALHSNRP
jgi:undecaprenyl-diphosphatase